MIPEQKKVSILFLDSSPSLSLTTADLQAWLKNQFEIGLIADTEVEVIPAPANSSNAQIWKELVETIANRRDAFDGFLVVTHLESLLTTSAALSYMIQGLGKPLVFTSSPNSISYQKTSELTQDFGIRANLLNSLQVATLALPEPAIVFGNRIIRATRAVRSYDTSINLFQAFQSQLLGSIDFGVHLTEQASKLSPDFKIFPEIEQHIFVVDSVLGGTSSFVPDDAKGIISRGLLTQEWIKQYAKGRPVWSATDGSMTWEAALVKFAWVLAQTQDPVEVTQLMTKNVAGELGEI